MEVKDYKPRVCDVELQEQLEASGAVLIEGAKWCGKTYMYIVIENSPPPLFSLKMGPHWTV